jgi:hypothetical protein
MMIVCLWYERRWARKCEHTRAKETKREQERERERSKDKRRKDNFDDAAIKDFSGLSLSLCLAKKKINTYIFLTRHLPQNKGII